VGLSLPDGVIAAGGALDQIVAVKVSRIELAKRSSPLELLAERALGASKGRAAFRAAIEAGPRTRVIAEIKRRSPSRGLLRADFDPFSIAGGYARAGAAAISVLTEEDFFGGSLEHLEAARRAKLPVLRKDFIFDEYQLYESAAAGADAVLLVVAILSDQRLRRLLELADELKLDCLVEVHTAREMGRALDAGARLIGINNRDLVTLSVDLGTSFRLAPLAPRGATLVSESGIKSGRDIRALKAAGFRAFLIGEHLMLSEDPGGELARLIREADGEGEG
jgi:indole-3-glycerol phosphate synthase